MLYAEIGKTWKKLALISEHAKGDPNVQFISLAHLLDKEFLEDCYNSLNKNRAVGIDNVTWAGYGENLEANLDNLITRLKRKSYKPIPAKRVYIPKKRKGKTSSRNISIRKQDSGKGNKTYSRKYLRTRLSGFLVRISPEEKLSSSTKGIERLNNDSTGKSCS